MSRDTILVATDLRHPGDPTVRLSATLARALRVPVRLIHATDAASDLQLTGIADSVRPAAEAMRERVRERLGRLSDKLEEAAGPLKAADVVHSTSLEEGRPWEAILEMAARLEAGLVIVGPHGRREEAPGRGTLADRLLGSTADRVARHCTVPVLVACGVLPEKAKGAKVAVAVDFSDESRAALRQADRLAGALGGSLILIHALPQPVDLDDVPETWTDLMHELAKEAEERLGEEARAVAVRAPIETRVVHGLAADALCHAAADVDADFLVIGTRGHGRLASLVLGSVAERVLRRSPIPVLVTRVGDDSGLTGLVEGQ